MRRPVNALTLLGFAIMMLFATNASAQYATAEEAKNYINDRLSHSLLQKIDPDGTVTMNAPGQRIKFKLREVSFNYNGGNNDDRVRVFGDNCIEHYEHKSLTERTSRQSFLCESEKEANEVIGAFRFLKKMYGTDPQNPHAGDKKLNVLDSTMDAKTVGEAIDFINENLSYSMITIIDGQGMMTINAPDEIYQVDLKKADFGYNDASDGSKVRIYGDFCIGLKESGGKKELIARKSFQTPSRVKAYQVITVLYYLKSTFSGMDPAKITRLVHVNGTRINKYANAAEAIDFINSRFTYSIILGVDKAGNMTINAPEEIYRFNLYDVKANSAMNRSTRSDWFPFSFPGSPAIGVMFECNDCIKQFESPDSFDTLDEQVFQCGNTAEVKEVIKAISYLRDELKK